MDRGHLVAASWPINLKKDLSLRQSFDLLRGKWGEVPYTQYDRISSTNLLSLPDQEILQVWNNAYMTTSTGPGFSVRGWYQLLYKDQLRDRIAAPATSRRKLYDMIVGTLRDRQPK